MAVDRHAPRPPDRTTPVVHKESLGISTQAISTSVISAVWRWATAEQIPTWAMAHRQSRRQTAAAAAGRRKDPPHPLRPVNTNPAQERQRHLVASSGCATATTAPTIGIGRFPVGHLSRRLPRWRNTRSWATRTSARQPGGPELLPRLTLPPFREQHRDERLFVEVTEKIRNHAVGGGCCSASTPRRPPPTPTTHRSGAPVPADLRKPGFSWTGNGNPDIASAPSTPAPRCSHHRDHGSWYGFGDPGFMTARSTASGDDNRYPCVVFSINCASGIFDNETVDLPGHRGRQCQGPSPLGHRIS